MNLQTLDDTLENRTTRRRIVATGAKLAYAAPLVALSFKVSARGTAAITPVGGDCFHSNDADTSQSCMFQCAEVAGCGGEQCNGFGGPPGEVQGPCSAACTLSPGNRCPSADYCNPDCFECDASDESANFVC